MKGTTQKAWSLLRPHAAPRLPALLAVAVLGSLASLGQTSIILLIEPMWNGVLFPAEGAEGAPAAEGLGRLGLQGALAGLGDFLLGWTEADSPMAMRERLLLGTALLGLAIAFFSAACEFGFIWLSRWVSLRMVVDLRLRLARHLMGLSLRYHGERNFGDLLSRISSDVTKTLDMVNTALRDFIRQPAFALGWLTLAFFSAPRLTLGAVVVLPLVILPVGRILKRVRRGSTRSLSSLGTSVQALTQMFQGIRTVKSFRAEERELERFREYNETYLEASMRMVRDIALAGSVTTVISVAGMAVMIAAVGWATLHWELFADAPSFLVFFMAFAQFGSKLKTLTRSVAAVEESLGASERLLEILAERVDLVEVDDPEPLRDLGSGVRFEGVTFRYPSADRAALSDLDLEVRPGETLAVVGPSGAGKSTLIDLLCRFLDPTEGRLTVGGVDLARASLDDWVRLYALVGQTPFLFHDTIEANIRYGRPDATDEEIRDAARAADVDDFVRSLPDGYRTNVADAGAHLSGGQRQRITIARALLKGAPLLVLDEATSSLDSETEASVQEALGRLMTDRTVVVVAHRLSTIRNADRIAVLEDGKLVELGTHEDLLAQKGAYARLARLQGLEEAVSEV